MKRLALTLATCAALGISSGGVAYANADHPSAAANCIGAANSNGNGAFVSGLATTVPPGEFGATTSDTVRGPHGVIGVVASSDDCS
jgi:hypothetical protein